MSNQILFSIIPAILILVTGFLPAMSIILLFRYQTRNRKSPINVELLRSPGESLREQIDGINDALVEKIVFMMFIPVFIYSVLIGHYAAIGAPNLFLTGVAILTVILYCLWQSKKLYNLLVQRTHLRLGYGCEVATSQGLAPLAKNGFNIFHDFPASPNFNIDHIAVGPQGVFAVETKGRSKAVKNENENWVVTFDGKALIFPFGTDEKPVTQARRQAKWLSDWIENSTAEKLHVTPLVAIPGWYIKLPPKKTDVWVANGKNFSFLAKGQAVLSEKQIQRISFQIAEKCRTVEINAYKK